MPYIVEADQTGKIEQTSWDTVLAFSDGLQRAIRIPAKVKMDPRLTNWPGACSEEKEKLIW